ncbi:MAG: M1 family metallopeptidase [Thermoanaerobaculia bacterium]
MAQIHGGRDTAVYVYDDVLRHAESLETLRETRAQTIASKKYLYRTLVSEQLIQRDWKTRVVQNFFLVDVDLDLTASEKRDAKYTMTQTVVPQYAPRRVFKFSMPDDFGVGPGDVRNFHLRSVTGADGKPLEFDHRSDELIVATPGHVPVDQEVRIRYEVDGDFLVRPSGDSYWELGVWPWFPQPELGEQYYSFHAVVRVKKPFVPLSPGTTIRRVEEGEYNVVETKVEQPVQFAAILAGKYYFEEDTRDGLTVRIASYGLKNANAFKKLGNVAHNMIDYYELFLGTFPFRELNIIEKNDYGYGQAPPATMFITQEAFNPIEDEVSRMYSKGINHRFAHEIAHQYWGHVVKMPSGQEQWLTESFAEYSAALLMKKMKGKRTFDTMVNEWKASAKRATNSATIPMANRLAGDPFVVDTERTGLVYDKGAYLLSQIHKEVGDDQFLTFLKSYQKSFHFRYGTTAHVVGMLQFVTKKDYSKFFDENFWATGMPGK